MAKNLVLGTVRDEFITAISVYSKSMIDVEKAKAEVKAANKADEGTIAALLSKREDLLKSGVSFDKALAQTDTSKYEGQIAKRTKNFREGVSRLYNNSKNELLKDLGADRLYPAYVVGMTGNTKDYSRTGAVKYTVKENKDGSFDSRTYRCVKSFNTYMGEWLESWGVKNADNANAVKKFVESQIIPCIGLKVTRTNAHTQVFSYSAFCDQLLIAIKEGLMGINFLHENEDGSLERMSNYKTRIEGEKSSKSKIEKAA